MRISHLFGCALLALSSASLQAATSDAQAKCEQQLTAQQGKLETGKMLGQMLGNEKLSNAIAQVEGGCAELNSEELAANASATDQGAGARREGPGRDPGQRCRARPRQDVRQVSFKRCN